MANNRVSGITGDGFSIRLDQLGDRALRGLSKVITSGAKEIQKQARSNAPVDIGNLEEAIKVDTDRSGSHRRVSATVYVDETMPAVHYNADGSVTKGTEDKVVGDYVMEMHENLTPVGHLQLGPKSLDKSMSGHQVGGKFMERAFDDVVPGIIQEAEDIVRKASRET